MITYADKLKDPRWQKKRLEVFEAADWECHECSSKEKTLHVHHKKYVKGREPWEYENDELECLCEDCHKEVTKLDDNIKLALSMLDRSDKESVLGYCMGLIMWIDKTTPAPVNNYEMGQGIGAAFCLTAEELFEELGKDKNITFDKLDGASRIKKLMLYAGKIAQQQFEEEQEALRQGQA